MSDAVLGVLTGHGAGRQHRGAAPGDDRLPAGPRGPGPVVGGRSIPVHSASSAATSAGDAAVTVQPGARGSAPTLTAQVEQRPPGVQARPGVQRQGMGMQAAERHARRARLPQRGQQRLAGAPAVRPRVHEQVAQHRDGLAGPSPIRRVAPNPVTTVPCSPAARCSATSTWPCASRCRT